jgi:hypothetical protein
MTMTKVYQVLWIEDDALFDLNDLATAVSSSLKYKLKIARNVTEGIENILRREFDVIIVDVRLPPGNDQRWAELFINARAEVEQNLGNKLGLQLLHTLLNRNGKHAVTIDIPSWVTPDRFAVFTVEERSTCEPHLTDLGVKVHVKKKAGLPPSTLRDLIDLVLKNRSGASSNGTHGGGTNGNSGH